MPRYRDEQYTSCPPQALVIKEYDELADIYRQFFEGKRKFVLIIGRPGLSKSFSAKQYVKDNDDMAVIIKGNISPSWTYMESFRNSKSFLILDDDGKPKHPNKYDKSLVLDDADPLWGHPEGLPLLRQMTESDDKKMIRWGKLNNQMRRENIPTQYVSSARIMVICNAFHGTGEEKAGAVLSRGVPVYFDPSPLTVHKYVSTWFADQEIFNYVADRLFLMPRLDCRVYVNALDAKKSKGNWKRDVERFEAEGLDACFLESWYAVKHIITGNKITSEENRVHNFATLAHQRGWSVSLDSGKRQYYNVRNRLGYQGSKDHTLPRVPKITLKK